VGDKHLEKRAKPDDSATQESALAYTALEWVHIITMLLINSLLAYAITVV
jgi:hypothetical protein